MSGFQYLAGRSARANYNQTKGGSVTVNSGGSFPATVISADISTKGNPVLIIVSGDANPLSAGAWGLLSIYRGASEIGQRVQYESSSANENVPYSLQVVDVPPAAGTYTYSLKCVSTTSNTTFGETAGPTITVIEL